MANVLKYKIKYFKRQITNDGTGLTTFFLDAEPEFLPVSGQRVMVSHTDLPEGESGIKSKLEEISTNVVTATFDEFIQDTENLATNDNYSNLIVLKYDDVDFANNAGAGSTRGYITYEVNPEAYKVLKPVENATIVTDTLPYDGDDAKNTLVGTTTGDTQTRTDIIPMAFVDRGNSNTIFSNFFTTFNLPVTLEEKRDFTRSTIGKLVSNPTDGDFLINGKLYDWTPDLNGTIVHPATGYTGTYYNTALEGLNVDEVLVIEIPQNQYGEIIDGKSIKLQLPSTGGTSTYTIYSAFSKNDDKFNTTGLDKFNSETNLAAAYFGNEPDLDEDLANYESNIAFLFSDEIKRPEGDANRTWSDGWQEVIDGERVYSPNAAQPKEFFDYQEDQAVGIAYLDRGMIVVTDQDIVQGFKGIYTSASGTAANIIYTSGDTNNSQFLITSAHTGATPQVEFLSYNTEKSLNVICLAAGDEFFRTTNSSAKELTGEEDKNFADFKSGSDTQYPVEITDVGLYDEDGNLLAICVPNEPIQKQWFDLSVMKIKIRL